MQFEKGDAVTFLIVDDDDVAVMAMERAIRKLGLTNPIRVARDGEEALGMLRGTAQAALDRPYVVTLDLNMPGMGGLDFLEEVRRDDTLQNSVIFVVTTSDAPNDIASAYSRNIAGYIVKENAFETLKSALAMVKDYIRIVRLPDEDAEHCRELRLAN